MMKHFTERANLLAGAHMCLGRSGLQFGVASAILSPLIHNLRHSLPFAVPPPLALKFIMLYIIHS